MANPIRKLVQLVLDKRAAQKTESETKKTLGTVDKGLAKLKSSALKLGAALAGAFAIRKLAQFGKELISVASESEAIWDRLGKAVEQVGGNFARARPEVEAFARAMQDTTRVGDEDFAEILTELITTSGDYGKSLRNVAVVADLAAAKQIEFRTAAQLVGRAMVGQTGTLSRYGIVVEEGQDAVEVLRETFRGFAQNEVKGLAGQTAQLSNEWGDFKQALGEVLTAAADGESIIQTLTAAIKGMTRAVQGYINATKGLPESFLGPRAMMAKIVSDSETAEQAIDRLVRQGELWQTWLENAERDAAEGEGWFARISGSRLLSDKEYEDAIDRVEGYKIALLELNKTIDRLRSGEIIPGGGGVAPPPTTAPGPVAESAAIPAGAIVDSTVAVDGMTDAWARLNQEMEMSPENAARLATQLEEAQVAAKAYEQQMIAAGIAGRIAGDLLYGAFGAGIPALAKQKAQQNAILAAEQIAEGFVLSLNPLTAPLAGAHYAAAGQYAAIASAWGALAGVTGGFSGGGGGGGRGAPSDTGGAASERAEQPGPEVHIHFVGPGFNATNPEVQRVIYGAQQEISQRYGNAKVKIHRDR